MKTNVKISGSQLAGILFLSQVFALLNFTPPGNNEVKPWLVLLGILIGFVVKVLFFVPFYVLLGREKEKNLIDVGYHAFGKGGVIFAILFLVYLVFIAGVTTAQFTSFLNDRLFTGTSQLIICITLVLAALYGAYMGIEAIARTASIAAFLLILSVVFVGVAVIPRVEVLNLKAFLPPSAQELWQYTLPFISMPTDLLLFALLRPQMKGNTKKSVIGSFALTTAVLWVSTFFIYTVLGGLASRVTFPFYTLSTLAEVSIFRRLDSVHMMIWVFVTFIRLSVIQFCIARVLGYMLPFKVRRSYPAIGAALVLALSIWFTSRYGIFYGAYLFQYTPFVMVLFVLLIPAVLLVGQLIRKKGKNEEKN